MNSSTCYSSEPASAGGWTPVFEAGAFLGTGKGVLAGVDLVKGQTIRLNRQAREWTEGRVFEIEQVKPYGVICWTPYTEDLSDDIHRNVNIPSRVRYIAVWDEIEGLAS